MNRFKIIFGLVFILLKIGALTGQNEYKMNDGSASDCDGIFTDSEANQQAPGKYANNENLIFKLCVQGAGNINLKFNSFCTEARNDVLRIFRGGDTTGTLLGTYHGSQGVAGSSLPPSTMSVSDSCITFHFKSDNSIVCDGWEIEWESQIMYVPQPVFDSVPNPPCYSNKLIFSIDQFVYCDSLKTSSFTLTGAKAAGISKITPINCVNGMTKTFELEFSSDLDRGGQYKLEYNGTFLDVCDSLWNIEAEVFFNITDCPITVELSADKMLICKGECAEITAEITGGDSTKYVFQWSPLGSGKGPLTVCPQVTTTYKLTVSDGVSVPGSDSITIVVEDPPVAQNDTLVCRNIPPFNLTASPVGGTWTGNGITNQTNGTFSPTIAGTGNWFVYYTVGQCTDSVLVRVRNVTAGGTQAACISSAPFMMTGFSPAGGFWTGNNIDSNGLFTPDNIGGQYIVTYHWNGCSSSKTVHISNIIIPDNDSVCQTNPQDTLQFSPPGGIWTGPGITDANRGYFLPSTAGIGMKMLIYTINGCRDTLYRFVKQINARGNQIVCPLQESFTLLQGLPAGGVWDGEGVEDSLAGIFNPGLVNMPGLNKNVVLTYSYDGCVAQKIMFMRQTIIYKDTVKMCIYDTALLMRVETIQNSPNNGLFYGNGIVGNTILQQRFDPRLAGHGYHTIVYDANTCKDSLVMEVYPRSRIQADTSICIAEDPITLYNGEGQGTWAGPGITNSSLGNFNPAAAGVGLKKILFTYPGKCTDTVNLMVTPLPTVNLSLPQAVYCFNDTQILLNFNPKGGEFSGNGLVDSFFNPALAGEGTYQLSYTFGEGKCKSTAYFTVTVAPPLKVVLTADKDSACMGQTIRLTATPSGGDFNNYKTTWWNGITNTNEIFTTVNGTIQAFIQLTDGCSEPASDTLEIFVQPPVKLSFVTSDVKCFGDSATVKVMPEGNGPWTYQWDIGENTDSLLSSAGTRHTLTVIHTNSGCRLDTFVTLPSYSYVKASFSLIPSVACINEINSELQIIDLSQNGLTGFWKIESGTKRNYIPGENFMHQFLDLDSSTVSVKLLVFNEGGCADSTETKLCVQDTMLMFVPNAFSPGLNSDGLNDKFMVVGTGIGEFQIKIFNFWGEKLYESNDMHDGWDGTYLGKPCPEGFYVFTISYYGRKIHSKHIKGWVYLHR
jgi:gliding motility-associated-like protein